MEQFAHLARRQKDVITTVFGHQKTEAVAMRDNASAHQVHAVDQPIGALAVDGQFAIPTHGREPPLHALQGLGPSDPAPLDDLFATERFTGFGQQHPQVFAAGRGLRIFQALLFVVGITGLPISFSHSGCP